MVVSRDRQERQMPRGGKDSAPHDEHRCTSRRPSWAAAQNGSVSSVTPGGIPVVASIVLLAPMWLRRAVRALRLLPGRVERVDLVAVEAPAEQHLCRAAPGRG